MDVAKLKANRLSDIAVNLIPALLGQRQLLLSGSLGASGSPANV